MAAPKGNKFWEARSSHGRAPIFKTPDDLWSACVEYFQWCEDNPLQEAIVYQGVLNTDQSKPLMRAMTISGLCLFLDIDKTTWENYRQKEDFFRITTRAEAIIYNQKFAGASAGLLNANIIARDLGLSDKSELTGKDGGPMQHSVIAAEMTQEQATRLYQELIKS